VTPVGSQSRSNPCVEPTAVDNWSQTARSNAAAHAPTLDRLDIVRGDVAFQWTDVKGPEPVRPIAILWAALVLATQPVALSQDAVKDAVAFGARFKSADQFLDDGLKPYKFKIAGVMATDGTSKYVTLLTDWTTIAAASADAHRRLRSLTEEEFTKFPNSGLIQAIAEMHARGIVPVHRMQGRYGNGRTHLVLTFGETIVQPLDQRVMSDVSSPAYQLWVFTSTTFGSLGWALVQPAGGWPEEKIVTNFTFSLSEQQRRSKGKLILIDGNGSKDDSDVDFGKLK
jgi:hypothetical protein